MMLLGSVGFTAMDVSLCGPSCSQSVLTFAAVDVFVWQIGVPIFAPGLVPKTALVTGAGASTTLCTKSIGWGAPSSSAAAETAATNEAASAVDATTASDRTPRRMAKTYGVPLPCPRTGDLGAPIGRWTGLVEL